MASQLSEILELVAGLRESVRHGDWKTAGEIAAILPKQTLPDNHDEMGEYLCGLKEALIVAKTSRAHAAASLLRLNTAAARINAAARFTGTSY
jgi:hypothetical protein